MKTTQPRNDILTLTMHALVNKIKNKEISSQELLELQLEHISEYNPSINAVVTINEEHAHEKAMKADEALQKGKDWGPLHGLPITIKDAYEVKGITSTGGSAKWKEHIPKTDAVVADRLRKAGAILLVKVPATIITSD